MPRRIHLLPPEYEAAVRPVTAKDSQFALCRELEYLRSEIKRLKGINSFKDETLLYMARLLENQLRESRPLTFERVKRLISQLKGAVDRERGGLSEELDEVAVVARVEKYLEASDWATWISNVIRTASFSDVDLARLRLSRGSLA